MSRPSDEMMVEVGIAWKDAEPCQHIEYFRPWWEINCGLDPRDDTDAAQELVGWLWTEHEIDFQIDDLQGACWGVGDIDGEGDRPYSTIPISGEPFRYAVCNLAVEIVKNKPQE